MPLSHRPYDLQSLETDYEKGQSNLETSKVGGEWKINLSTIFSIASEPTASAQERSIPRCFRPAFHETPQLSPMVKTMSPLRRTTESEEVRWAEMKQAAFVCFVTSRGDSDRRCGLDPEGSTLLRWHYETSDPPKSPECLEQPCAAADGCSPADTAGRAKVPAYPQANQVE
ncbi:hypothetical protein GJ744_011566 [Endocarpon pusillum]|uniref:Uncharacterized protein n=1 Tax=Endocarpon pusillum TaxID=364733 RepID=A0A8H7E124_9EURO|nr:hypothetical protein GJ744_011566 [Endocarpon pusillum]